MRPCGRAAKSIHPGPGDIAYIAAGPTSGLTGAVLSNKVEQASFVEARGRPWLVEAVDDSEPGLTTIRLSCISDDAQGEQIEVLWDAEIGASILEADTWSRIGKVRQIAQRLWPLISEQSAGGRPPLPTEIFFKHLSGLA